MRKKSLSFTVKSSIVVVSLFLNFSPVFSQTKRLAVTGSSTAAGLATSSPDSAWVTRFARYAQQQGILQAIYNLGVSSTNLYHGMPSGYTPPAGRPSPNPANNVTQAVGLLSDLATPSNGVIIVNYPSGGYDTYTIPEIMSALQLIYDSATRTGNKCYITTTQPRTDGNFAASAVKRKLADIKDSIVNRFGVAHTINFWDGMFNPADTTILPAYASGDNVHFNNAGHRVLFERVRAKNIFDEAVAAYRSNVNPTGLWSSASSWQVFNGSVWEAATTPPSSGSGTITIQNQDSIRINSYTELDQVVIEEGGVLTIFNNTGTTPAKSVVTLNNGSGDDLINNGRLYISGNGVLEGDGSLVNNAAGLFTIRNRGVLGVNTSNNGTISVNATGIVRGRTLTNNRTFILQDLTLNLIRSTFINNDSLHIAGSGSTFVADSTLAGGFFINNANAVIFRQSNSGTTAFNNSVTFTNNGIVKGFGTYAFYNSATGATGSIAPGSSPGKLTVNPAFITNRTPVINIEISNTGAVQGTDYDHLEISNVSPTTKNISGATLNVTDLADDPIGTEYTIITPVSGTITGNFAAVNLSPTLSGPFYNGRSFITVVKSSVLPLMWGEFNATDKNGRTELHWTTFREENTAYFDVEHSLDGSSFTIIGTVPAQNNPDPAQYSYIHTAPDRSAINYYRLRQVDSDGKHTYSNILTMRFDARHPGPVTAYPNPVASILQLEIKPENVRIVITDMNGNNVRNLMLRQGMRKVDLSDLPQGTYTLTVYEKSQRVDGWKMIKL